MPARLKRACRKPLCPGTTTHKSGYCEKHQKTESGWNQWQKKKGNDTRRGYGWAWRKLRQQILKRDCCLCQECQRKGILKEGNVVDHIKPKAQGGDDSPANLQTLCTPCHNHKTATERQTKGRG